MTPEEQKAKLSAMREALAGLVAELHLFASSIPEGVDLFRERVSNAMLALRHLEDGAMRLGKVIQAVEGGKSPLGGPATPGATTVSGNVITPPAQ